MTSFPSPLTRNASATWCAVTNDDNRRGGSLSAATRTSLSCSSINPAGSLPRNLHRRPEDDGPTGLECLVESRPHVQQDRGLVEGLQAGFGSGGMALERDRSQSDCALLKGQEADPTTSKEIPLILIGVRPTFLTTTLASSTSKSEVSRS